MMSAFGTVRLCLCLMCLCTRSRYHNNWLSSRFSLSLSRSDRLLWPPSGGLGRSIITLSNAGRVASLPRLGYRQGRLDVPARGCVGQVLRRARKDTDALTARLLAAKARAADPATASTART